MKKLIAVAISSTALLAAPGIFAQTAQMDKSAAHTGGHTTKSDTVPLTPSQVQTSEGAAYNQPPLDRSGHPTHVSEKGPGTGTGQGEGQTGNDAGTGAAGGAAGDAGSGSSGTGSSGGDGGAAGSGSGSSGGSGGGN